MASTSSQCRGRNDNIPVDRSTPKRDVFGSPKTSPRIGLEYQAELPRIIKRSDYMSSSTNHDMIELPITLTRMNNNGLKKNLDKTSKKSVKDAMRHEDVAQTEEEKMLKFCDDFVPGSIGKIWSEAEKASFILGLHIFYKNFVELRHFVETKDAGDIMMFYYGEFYRSDEYFRWSERRTARGKKTFVFGQKFFSGLRQQELISRLVARVPERCKSSLLKVSETFLNKNMTLSGRLLSLKAMVGINLLVEAIAIGKGKKDLTRVAVDFSGSNNTISAHKQAPPRKPCGSLTVSEIIETLNGDCCLSKARTNELFWEAVWPRLIERGWTAEEVEPGKGDRSNGLNLSLIYLVPGAKNLPRQNLVKGEHYFDSATDVLGRVSCEPGLILLPSDNHENVGDNGPTGGGENGPEEGGNGDGGRRQLCPQPRPQNRSLHAVKYTVVDTSAGGKLLEVRSLPCETDLGDCMRYGKQVDPMEENEGARLENEMGPKSGRRRKGKNRGGARHKEPVSKHTRRILDNDTCGEIEEVIRLVGRTPRMARSPAGPEMPSGLVPSEVHDEPLFSGPSEGDGSSKGRTVGPAGSLDNTHCPLPFDLNELPQSEPEGDDRPAMADQDPDVNPDHVRQSGRGLHFLAMAMEDLVNDLENRKRKCQSDRADEGSSRRRARAGAGLDRSTSSSAGSGGLEDDIDGMSSSHA